MLCPLQDRHLTRSHAADPHFPTLEACPVLSRVQRGRVTTGMAEEEGVAGGDGGISGTMPSQELAVLILTTGENLRGEEEGVVIEIVYVCVNVCIMCMYIRPNT